MCALSDFFVLLVDRQVTLAPELDGEAEGVDT